LNIVYIEYSFVEVGLNIVYIEYSFVLNIVYIEYSLYWI